MKELEEKILKEGAIRPGHIVKVDSFLNHQVDVGFLHKIGDEFYKHFKDKGVNKIVTIESSGIAIAMATAESFSCKLLFAKKGETLNQSDEFYQTDVYSYTYQKTFRIRISKEYIDKNDKVLIIDDFLANGEALKGLLNVVKQSGAEVVGCGVVIEKSFQPGGKFLREKGIDVFSLAMIEEIDADKQIIKFKS